MTSISAERSKLADVGIRLRRRNQWGARRSYTDPRTVVEPAEQQYIHITVTNPGNYNSNDAHARAIEAIGISRFPNTGISYNRLIMPDGTVYEAQPIGRRGAHTVNNFRRSTCSTSGCPSRGRSISAPSWNNNYNSRAYAICQNVNDPVTDAMVESLARCTAADKLAGFVERGASLHGHRCVSAKSCPGDRMWARMDDVKRRHDHYLDNGLQEDDMPSPKDWDRKDWQAFEDHVYHGGWRQDRMRAPRQHQNEDNSNVHMPESIMRGGNYWSWVGGNNSNRALAELAAIRKAMGANVDEIISEVSTLVVAGILDALEDSGQAIDTASLVEAVKTAMREGTAPDDENA